MPFKKIPPLYHVWMSMKDRCGNPNAKAYPSYGGRGISVCDRWKSSYAAFAEDMGDRPDGTSIERIDNEGNYELGNCRWATKTEQQRNRRVAVYVTVEGVRYRALELAEQAGVKTDTIVDRARRGLPLSEVVSREPLRSFAGLSLGGLANGVRQRSKTHCPKGHSYEDAIVSKQGFRRCRTCFYAKEQARRAAKAKAV